jgi:hypothetical protein
MMLSNANLSLVPSMCFYPRYYIRFNLITVAVWIRESPEVMIVENAESIELAITFAVHSTDSDNAVLLSDKENFTHGTLCSFPSVDI